VDLPGFVKNNGSAQAAGLVLPAGLGLLKSMQKN
jgi:hypothetical protein